jgi:hypothetical protein
VNEFIDNSRGSICCADGFGFVIHSFSPEAEPDNLLLGSLAAYVAHRMMDWLLERDYDNTRFCVSTSARCDSDGAGMDEIVIATDLKQMPLNEDSRHGLQQFVRQRLSHAPLAHGYAITMAWNPAQ